MKSQPSIQSGLLVNLSGVHELFGLAMAWDVTGGMALRRAADGSAVTTAAERLQVVDIQAHHGHSGAAAPV